MTITSLYHFNLQAINSNEMDWCYDIYRTCCFFSITHFELRSYLWSMKLKMKIIKEKSDGDGKIITMESCLKIAFSTSHIVEESKSSYSFPCNLGSLLFYQSFFSFDFLLFLFSWDFEMWLFVIWFSIDIVNDVHSSSWVIISWVYSFWSTCNEDKRKVKKKEKKKSRKKMKWNALSFDFSSFLLHFLLLDLCLFD